MAKIMLNGINFSAPVQESASKKEDNWKTDTDPAASYPDGISVFSSTESFHIGGFPRWLVYTIKAHKNAVTQFAFREADGRSTDICCRAAAAGNGDWTDWKRLYLAGDTIKAEQDGEGNVITRSYVKNFYEANVDFDSLTEPGMYTIFNSTQNAPTTDDTECSMIVTVESIYGYCHQMVYPKASTTWYTRARKGHIWSPWTEMLTSDKLLDKVYPVGSIYMNTNPVNPETLFGGTWEYCTEGNNMWERIA